MHQRLLLKAIDWCGRCHPGEAWLQGHFGLLIVPMLCAWERSHGRSSVWEPDDPCASVRLFWLHVAEAVARDTFPRRSVGTIKMRSYSIKPVTFHGSFLCNDLFVDLSD